MKYRHEVKHAITYADRLSIIASLSAVAQRDEHAGADGEYFIRSLYFDNLYNKALNEKADGLPVRDKYRIRYYNGDTSFMVLEKKSKIDGLCLKASQNITSEEVKLLLNGNTAWLAGCGGLLTELYVKMQCEGLRPKSIVDYRRIPFVYDPGNVRVTIDYDIRSSGSVNEFLNPGCTTLSCGDTTLLEVKWDEYLPSVIRQAVQLKGVSAGAFSKYAASRRFF